MGDCSVCKHKIEDKTVPQKFPNPSGPTVYICESCIKLAKMVCTIFLEHDTEFAPRLGESW